MSHIDAAIRITGPGLVVNGPARVVLAALRKAGFKVECEDWAGLDQWTGTDEELDAHVARHAPSMTIKVEVNPLPWGG